jgi:amino-acid N-acetyltransferase
MSAAEFVFRPAVATDLSSVAALLSDCDLPAQDLTVEVLSGFELAFAADGRLVGQIGLEAFGDIGLMRSLAVAPESRAQGLGEQLVARREAEARRAALTAVYLLTTTAADYFRRRAYEDVSRETVPAAIAAHAQFRSLCPSSARCLCKAL